MTHLKKSDHSPESVPLQNLQQVCVDSHLDARGLLCPMPLLKAKMLLNTLKPGSLLSVVATDSGSVRDFHSFARLSKHCIHSFAESEGEYFYIIQKANE